jgi:lipoprotein signal peptidase
MSNLKKSGMRISGGYCGILFCRFFYDCCFSGKSMNNILFFGKILAIRASTTRIASWLTNDIPGNWNTIINRPNDATLYEALFEGIIPSMCLYFINLTMFALSYFVGRCVIEYKYKQFRIQSYVDCLFIFATLLFVQSDMYISGLFYILLYIDCILRINNNIKNMKYEYKNIEINFTLKYNDGFYNSEHGDSCSLYKILYNASSIVFFGFIFYSLASLEILILFLISSSINLIERMTREKITDYIQIKIKNKSTNYFNIADVGICIAFCLMIFNLLPINHSYFNICFV